MLIGNQILLKTTFQACTLVVQLLDQCLQRYKVLEMAPKRIIWRTLEPLISEGIDTDIHVSCTKVNSEDSEGHSDSTCYNHVVDLSCSLGIDNEMSQHVRKQHSDSEISCLYSEGC